MAGKRILGALVAAALTTAAAAGGQTTVTLPDTSLTTEVYTKVAETADVTVPAGVIFPVLNVAAGTTAGAASMTVSNILLETATKQLKISIQAGAASFTPPVSGATTWSASDVTWNAATWTNATGVGGILSSSAFTEVATCNANVASCGTTGLVFTLAPKSTVKRAGDHILSITWKFESIGL
ncbi:MAG TPA: hypothetical protein VGX68_04575 [Thermoanaerobaculia bacterium]|jgi:hypothetical protein|nr:hypothetical protein [Thermoanaerobaculia bacterium]